MTRARSIGSTALVPWTAGADAQTVTLADLNGVMAIDGLAGEDTLTLAGDGNFDFSVYQSFVRVENLVVGDVETSPSVERISRALIPFVQRQTANSTR
jgi:hypothetical protein